MRSIKMAFGLAVAVTCLLAVSAASALAAPVWEQKVGGVFSEIKAATAASTEGKLKLEDLKGGINKEAVQIECTVKSTGKIGAGSADSIEKTEATKCTVIKGTCGTPTVEALHTPWTTELVAGIRDNIKNSGAGLPGWKVTCTILFVKVVDTCETETSTSMANNEATGNVEATFNAESPKAKCSRGGAETGVVEGVLTTAHPAGTEAIRVK
jgi:hypothetical protein